jgi:hypothetical protein
MSSLEQIRESLAALQAYKLPERYEPLGRDASDNSDPLNTQPLLDAQTIQRYQAARAKYLKSQITSLIIEHLDHIRYESGGEDSGRNDRPIIDFPDRLTEEQKKDLQERIQTARDDLVQSVNQVKQSYEGVYQKYQMLQNKRLELEGIVSSMEKQNQNAASGGSSPDGSQDVVNVQMMDIDDEDYIVDQTELELQDEKIRTLLEKKSALEAKLRKVRMETEKVANENRSKKELLQKLMDKSKGYIHGRVESPTTVLDLDNLDVQSIKAETANMRQKIQEYRDMSEYYASMRSALEVISGVKILSVTDAESTDNNETLPDHGDRIVLKVQLLEKHIVEIILENCKKVFVSTAGRHNDECFRVVSARILTSTILTDTLPEDEEEFQNNPSPTVSITIPPLDDLVSLAKNLEPVHDLRFVLRETLSRIRILSNRMNELATLRTKYLTKITDPANNKVHYGFGGEDQEILCSLDSQVTVVLRLTPDCPILRGSAYIQRIIGCGGWDDAVLHRIKDNVNEKRFCGPVDLMDSLVEEIESVVKEQGIEIPKTPVLPRRK